MPPELIEIGIIVAIGFVVIRMLFAFGKKLVGLAISFAISVYIFTKPLWPYIETIIQKSI